MAGGRVGMTHCRVGRARWGNVLLLAAALSLDGCKPSLGRLSGTLLPGASEDGGFADAGTLHAQSGDAAALGVPFMDAGDSSDHARLDASISDALDGGSSSSLLADAGGPRGEGGAKPPNVADGGDGVVRPNPDWPFDGAAPAGFDAGSSAVEVAKTPIVVDGDISEWPDGIWWPLLHLVHWGDATSARTEDDLSAVCAWRVWQRRLYLAVVVRDDIQTNHFSGFDIWKGDSLQVAFDVGHGRVPYDWEYGFALVDDGIEVHRWLDRDGQLGADFPAAIEHRGGITVYEIGFDSESLGMDSMASGALRVSIAVNETDSGERTDALELAPGIVETEKTSSNFITIAW